jgi:hypothetical protein
MHGPAWLFIDMALLSVSTGMVALTLTRSQITKPLRLRFINAPFMIGDLISCPYCMAHWVGFVALLMLWTAQHPLTWTGYVTVYFTIVGAAVLFIGIVQRLWLMQEGEIEQMRELMHEAHRTITDLEQQVSHEQD